MNKSATDQTFTLDWHRDPPELSELRIGTVKLGSVRLNTNATTYTVRDIFSKTRIRGHASTLDEAETLLYDAVISGLTERNKQ